MDIETYSRFENEIKEWLKTDSKLFYIFCNGPLDIIANEIVSLFEKRGIYLSHSGYETHYNPNHDDNVFEGYVFERK